MPAACAVPCRTGRMRRLGNRNERSIAQVRREHQHQRRDDAKREKSVERRKYAAEVARRSNGKPPGNCPRSQPGQGRDRSCAWRDLQSRAALRALDIVRTRRHFGRRNFRLAMRTHAYSQVSPPDTNAYNNRNRAPMKRKDGRAMPIAAFAPNCRASGAGAALRMTSGATPPSHYLRLRQAPSA